MIVENESNWRTDDLMVLLKSVMEQREFEKCTGVYEHTLILFKTSCKKDKVDKWDEDVVEKAPVADYDTWNERWDDTKIISIQSAARLEMPLLDRLGHIGEDVVQHMSTTNVKAVAKAVWLCLARHGGHRSDLYDFAEKLNMRTRSKITRSTVAMQREVDALYWKKQRILREAQKRCDKLEVKSDKLRAKILKG
jgi:hypothetical protein